MPSGKVCVSGRRFWSFTDGLMIKTSIFKFSSLLELLPGQNHLLFPGRARGSWRFSDLCTLSPSFHFVCLYVHCARLSLNLLIYSPNFLSDHSYPHALVLFFSLFTLLSCHWRSVKTAVKGCLCFPCKQAILFCFLLLKVLPSSANPRVLPFICYPVNLPSLCTTGHNAPAQQCYHFPLSTGRVIQCAQVFPLQ